MEIPDVTCNKLEKACKTLEIAGTKKIIVQVTEPPRSKEGAYNEASRVIRQEILADGSVKLLVCNVDRYLEKESIK